MDMELQKESQLYFNYNSLHESNLEKENVFHK